MSPPTTTPPRRQSADSTVFSKQDIIEIEILITRLVGPMDNASGIIGELLLQRSGYDVDVHHGEHEVQIHL